MIQATARRSSFHAQGARAFYRGNPVYTQAAPLRIGLRLWGIDEYEVLCWGERLPTLGERIVWDIVHDPDSDDAGMVIHLVRSSAATLGSFCWNCDVCRHRATGYGRWPVDAPKQRRSTKSSGHSCSHT